MEVITKQMVIESVPKRWRHQYYSDHYRWMNIVMGDTEEIYNRLIALNPITEDGVTSVLGDGQRWTVITCDHCARDVDVAIVMDVTYGEYTTYICLDCLQQAVDAIKLQQIGVV